MKIVKVDPINIGAITYEEAYKKLFNENILEKNHGSSFKILNFCESKDYRKFSFEIQIHNVPMELKRFICGKNLKITTRQYLDKSPERWTISNRIKMHFIGAEFFKIKPFFYLEQKNNQLFFSAKVENHAIFPPGLSHIAEHFMCLQTEKELANFIDLIS